MKPRRPGPLPAAAAALAALLLAAGCALEPEPPDVDVPGVEGAKKTAQTVRATRRAYDGAPPVIPHEPFGASCTECHSRMGVEVPEVGFSPPSPHQQTDRAGAMARCTQCHVFQQTERLFVASHFEGLPQDLGSGRQLHPYAPPVIPHQILLRENCNACHAGPAAREAIRTDHPERIRCRQCHVEQHDAKPAF